MSTLKETIIYDLFTGLYTKEYFRKMLKEQQSPCCVVTITVENINGNVILDISKYLQKHLYISSRIESNKFSVIIPPSDKAEKFISDFSETIIKNQQISVFIDKK